MMYILCIKGLHFCVKKGDIMPRITIEFSEQLDNILKDLAQEGNTSKVEIIRRALALYNYVNKEVKHKDLKLSVTGDDDKLLKEIVLDL
jgi:hypothetical protein